MESYWYIHKNLFRNSENLNHEENLWTMPNLIYFLLAFLLMWLSLKEAAEKIRRSYFSSTFGSCFYLSAKVNNYVTGIDSFHNGVLQADQCTLDVFWKK